MDERTELTFMLHGLPDRDAKLFRSYVLMVNHRTRHRWTWRESQADMTVVHGELAQAPAAPPALTLRVGGPPRGAFLRVATWACPARRGAGGMPQHHGRTHPVGARQTGQRQGTRQRPAHAASADAAAAAALAVAATADEIPPYPPGHLADRPAHDDADPVPALGPVARDLRRFSERAGRRRPAALGLGPPARRTVPRQPCAGQVCSNAYAFAWPGLQERAHERTQDPDFRPPGAGKTTAIRCVSEIAP